MGAAAPTPPFRRPGQHFAAGLTFLLAGAGLLVWRSPALAAGTFTDPSLLAAAHLLTLGWISTSIMGALHQFLPVALGAGIRGKRAADIAFGGWVLGVVAFASGVAGGWRPLYLAGAILLGIAALLFAGLVADAVGRSGRRGLTGWCVAGATVALVAAWLLGGLLALNLETGLLGGSRFAVLAVHLHVAVGGWVLLTMIGVADHLLPMFLLSHGASRLPGRIAAALVGLAGAALLLTGTLLPAGALRPALFVLAAGAAAFLLQAALFFRHGRRPTLDPGMQLVAAALLLLGLAVAAGTRALLTPGPGARLLTVYGVLLIPGGLSLFVAGHYYRILPFLTWFHRYGPVAADEVVPRVSELFDHRVARAAASLLVGGISLLAAGVLLGTEALCLAGAAGFVLGTAVMDGQMLRISRKRPT